MDGNATSMPNGGPEHDEIVETPFLIVGAGPAGASLACFLAEYGLTGIIVVKAPGTAKEPRYVYDRTVSLFHGSG